MSTLADRRKYKRASSGHIGAWASWRDFVAALIFAVFGMGVSAIA